MIAYSKIHGKGIFANNFFSSGDIVGNCLRPVLKKDIDLFKILFHFTPTRTSVDEPKVQWKTKRSPLKNCLRTWIASLS